MALISGVLKFEIWKLYNKCIRNRNLIRKFLNTSIGGSETAPCAYSTKPGNVNVTIASYYSGGQHICIYHYIYCHLRVYINPMNRGILLS